MRSVEPTFSPPPQLGQSSAMAPGCSSTRVSSWSVRCSSVITPINPGAMREAFSGKR
ncbi:MAG: hypothetical protein IPM35_04135 [Myxococcales bacterium]|nr:hypothetical protein [Myxococcales bacterium]